MTARRITALAAALLLTTAMGALPAASQTTGQAAPAGATTAQAGPAALVADRVFITPERTLVAEGNVEAFQGETRLRAKKIVFDDTSGKLTITGPIRIDHGGDATILADFAELDRTLQDGLLTGARMVFNQQLQIASLQMTRVGGRYSQMYKTAVTSCHVCSDGRPPLWQIRARKITHDEAERHLYFEDAQFLVYDVPILYLPGMRLPDPTLERATGFLIPSVRSTSTLGTGIKVPYFFRLGDHADLTLTPYYSNSTSTMEYRYRQAFRAGRVTFEGAHTRDDLIDGEDRGYLFGNGHFELGRGYMLDFDIQTVSDDAYLVDYGHEDLDRLKSELAFSRYKMRSAFRTRLIYYDSLREDDDDSEQPSIVMDSSLERRFFPSRIGGELRANVDFHAHHRTSDEDVVGRDVTRATADLNWRQNWILSRGLRLDWQTGFAADTFSIDGDSNYPDRIDRATPYTAVKLSLPMTRVEAGGAATQFLEPVVQLAWSDVNGGDVPVDESTIVEFDQGNLLSLSRFPASDQREDGLVLAYGVNWARYGSNGWTASASFGQVVRQTADSGFSETSGLSGTTSDVLAAAQLRLGNRLSLTGRTLLGGGFDIGKAELRGSWTGENTRLEGTYLWLSEDEDEDRDESLSEIWFNGGYDITPNWSASASVRYDIASGQTTRSGLGVVYQNECVTLDFRVNRRYTSSSSIEPTTDFGFSISLSGFSVDKGSEKYKRSCS